MLQGPKDIKKYLLLEEKLQEIGRMLSDWSRSTKAPFNEVLLSSLETPWTEPATSAWAFSGFQFWLTLTPLSLQLTLSG